MACSGVEADELGKAKKVVSSTMKLKLAKILFNDPVDPDALGIPNYLKVVKQPMDLGTIHAKLVEGEQQDWQQCSYASASQVFRDVSLVWSNCVLFNNREVDKPTRDAAVEVKGAFETKWKEAGLALESADTASKAVPTEGLVSEASIAAAFGTTQEGVVIPLRQLDNFTVIRSATLQAADLITLWTSTLAVLGTVNPAVASKGKKQPEPMGVKTDTITDWGFCYSSEPSVWVTTQLAWYKLLNPSEHYAQLHAQLQRLLDLCSSAVKLLKHNSSLTPLAAAQAALAEESSEDSAEEQWPGQIAFVEAQLSAWMEAAAGGAKAKGNPKSLSGIRLGKHGMTVSCKSAAEAATSAAAKHQTGQAASRKRKHSFLAGDDTQPAGKGRKVSAGGSKAARPGTGKLKGHSRAAGQDSARSSADVESAEDDSMQASGSAFSSSDASGSDSEDKEVQVAADRASRRPSRAGSIAKAVHFEALQSAKKSRHKKQAGTSSQALAAQMEQSLLPTNGKLVGTSRMKREREAQIARGPAPEPCRDFRLPQHQIPALLMVWEFTQMLSQLLQLAPCPLWRLEAAIAPGPHLPQSNPAQPEHATSTQDTEQAAAAAAEVGGSDHSKGEEVKQEQAEEDMEPDGGSFATARQTRRGRPAKQTGAKAAKQSGPASHTPAPKDGANTGPDTAAKVASPIDTAGSASAVLLRDIHCALLRAVEERALEREKPQPSQAKLLSPDSAGPVPWTANVARVILSAPVTNTTAPAKAAALKLAYMEYADLGVGERLALLQGLLEMALEVETVREHISARVEAMAPPSRDKSRQQAREAKEAGTNPKELEVTAQPGSCEEWLGWMGACRVGCRKALGYDAKRHRYWALGAGLGAWRVYVEEAEGALWGWYEGASLVRLVEWLKAGGIERESALLKALAQAPIPKKLPQQGVEVALTTDPSAEGDLLSSSELEARRPDGFKFVVAPVLRGEGNWASVSMYGSMEQRMQHTLEVLLARLPFWLKGSHWLARHGNVLQAIGAARTGADYGKALLFVEGMLMEQEALKPSWGGYLQEPWRQGLENCSEPRQAIMYLAALQEYMVDDSDVLPRQGFSQMARNMRCQLYIPHPTDQVVLLRTGVLHHINTYMQALGLAPPSDPPPAPKQALANGLPDQANTDSPAHNAGHTMAVDAAHIAKLDQATNGLHAEIPAAEDAVASAQRDLTDAATVVDTKGVSRAAAHGAGLQNGLATDLKKSSSAEGPHVVDFVQGNNASEGKDGVADLAARAVDWHGPIKPEQREGLLQAWQGLKATVEALPPVGLYTVASVAYRRSMVQTQAEDEEAVLSGEQPRRPVAWLLLRPPRTHHRGALQVLALPLSCDASMPDYIVKADVFEKGMKRHWHQRDRFRMFFATSYAHKAGGGVYYKGTVTGVREQMPAGGMGNLSKGTYDPWEALEVEWDVGGDAEGMDRVSPWEIENDPEEEKRMLEEARKAEEVAARNARLEAKAAKARRIAEGIDTDDDMAAPEVSEEQDVGDEAHMQDAPHTLPAGPAPSAFAAGPKPAESFLPAEDSEVYLEEEMSLGEGALQPLEIEYEQPPLTAGGTVSQEVLDLLGSLEKDAFVRLLINWYRRAKGRYKVPIFAHQELDLHKVFWQVQHHGGYDQVTNLKLWKEICRSLHLDLRGQTSASYNMRLNYEKCLLDFEKYLTSGRYTADLAVGTAPPTDVLEPAPAIKPTQGGPAGISEPHNSGYSTRGASRVTAGPAHRVEGSLSFTELLNMDLDTLEEEEDTPPPSAAPAAASGTGRAVPSGIVGVPVTTRPRTRRGIPAAATPVSEGEGATPQGGSGGQSGLPALGHVLHNMARGLLGKKVMRNWPDNGGWWEASVVGYGPTTGQHKLKYDEGEDEESIEWVDFRELTVEEIRQHPAHPVVQRPPVAPRQQPLLSASPAPRQPDASAPGKSHAAEQAAAKSIKAALQAGITASALHKMVDTAVVSLRTTSASAAPAKASAKPPTPSPAPVQPHPKLPSQEHKPDQESQHQRSAQKGTRHSTSSVQALHAKPAASEPSAAAAAAVDSATPNSAASDAPYSFRRHRRMDLQPAAQQHVASAGTPAPAVRAGLKTKIKLSTAGPADAPGGAQHAQQKLEEAPTAPSSTRNSIRIKLKRSGVGSKEGEPSSTSNGTAPRQAGQHASRSQSSAGGTDADELVQRASSVTGLEPASHDHLRPMNGSRDLDAHDDSAQADDLVPPLQQSHGSVGEMNEPDALQYNNGESAAGDDGSLAEGEEQGRHSDVFDHEFGSEHQDVPANNDDIDALSDIDLQDALGTGF